MFDRKLFLTLKPYLLCLTWISTYFQSMKLDSSEVLMKYQMSYATYFGKLEKENSPLN